MRLRRSLTSSGRPGDTIFTAPRAAKEEEPLPAAAAVHAARRRLAAAGLRFASFWPPRARGPMPF